MAHFEFHEQFNIFDTTVDHDHVDDDGRTHTFRAARPRNGKAERKAGEAVCRKTRAALRASLRNSKATRAYDRGQSNDRSKAIEYALWLAARDGVDLPTHEMRRGRLVEVEPQVHFVAIDLAGFKTSTLRASYVMFADVCVPLPHVDYDPTVMPVEIIDDEPDAPVPAAAVDALVEAVAPAVPAVDVFSAPTVLDRCEREAAAALDAIRDILHGDQVDGFDADDSGAQVHILPQTGKGDEVEADPREGVVRSAFDRADGRCAAFAAATGCRSAAMRPRPAPSFTGACLSNRCWRDRKSDQGRDVLTPPRLIVSHFDDAARTAALARLPPTLGDVLGSIAARLA